MSLRLILEKASLKLSRGTSLVVSGSMYIKDVNVVEIGHLCLSSPPINSHSFSEKDFAGPSLSFKEGRIVFGDTFLDPATPPLRVDSTASLPPLPASCRQLSIFPLANFLLS